MRWHPNDRERTFLRFIRRLAGYMGIPAEKVCVPMAWHFYAERRMSAFEAFRFLAR